MDAAEHNMTIGQAIKAYFRPIWTGTVSTLLGFRITMRSMVRDPKQTIHYPDIDIRTGDLRPRKDGFFAWLLNGNRARNLQAGYIGRLSQRIASRYRGILNVDIDICTACLACERACPINCIQIDVDKDPANPKLRVMPRFVIDIGKCMYCGLCSEPCPTGAIYHTKEFEQSTTDFPDLILDYADIARVPYKVKKLAAEAIELGAKADVAEGSAG